MAKGGKNEPNNLVALCEGCHSMIHPHMRTRYLKKLQFELFLRSEDPVYNLIYSFLQTIMAFKPKEVPYRESRYYKGRQKSSIRLPDRAFQEKLRRIARRTKKEVVKR